MKDNPELTQAERQIIEQTALSIEKIFKNTQRIHGRNKLVDWIKIASYKAAGHLITKGKRGNFNYNN